MQVDVKVDGTALVLRLRNGQRRLAYAVVNALNETAKDVQRAAHQQTRSRFVVRNERFLFGNPARPGGAAGRISTFASVPQRRAYAEVMVGMRESVSTAARRLLLPTFEEGGERKPFTPGAKSVAVPLLGRPARPAINRPVPPAYTFAGLKLRAFEGGKKLSRKAASGHRRGFGVLDEFGRRNEVGGGDGLQWKGENRTFLLTKSKNEPFGGVFQRIGGSRGDVRVIYVFRRGIRLDRRLGFRQLAAATISVRWPEHWQRAKIDALTRAGATSA